MKKSVEAESPPKRSKTKKKKNGTFWGVVNRKCAKLIGSKKKKDLFALPISSLEDKKKTDEGKKTRRRSEKDETREKKEKEKKVKKLQVSIPEDVPVLVEDSPLTAPMEEPWTPNFPSQDDGASHLQFLSNPHVDPEPAKVSRRNYHRLMVKSALSRGFCRPVRGIWQVEIKDGEWDATLGRYSYEIVVRDKVLTPVNTQVRTLQDFFWLEQSLRKEYAGALLCPLLHLYLKKEKIDLEEVVSGSLLGEWLSDLLNGVRCNGEYMLPPPPALSESLEAFLYLTPKRNHLPKVPSIYCDPCSPSVPRSRSTPISLFYCKSRAEQQSMEELRNCAMVCMGINTEMDALMAHLTGQLINLNAVLPLCETLLDQETMHCNLYKRFAITLSNLFAFEKDLETAKIGPSCQKTKWTKSLIDDGLRILTRRKNDRFIPSLQFIHAMLSANRDDLEGISPNFHLCPSNPSNLTRPVSRTRSAGNLATCWQMPALTIMEGDGIIQKEDEGELLMMNLIRVANAKRIQMARASWKWANMEATQISFLSSAGASLVEMIGDTTSTVQSTDPLDKEELHLVHQILNLGGDSPSVAAQREIVLNNAKSRMGRWNASLALQVMETAGVKDAEVRVEETTRELRLVRKYAIGLRECVERCMEAVDALTGTQLECDQRRKFAEALCLVFSTRGSKEQQDLPKIPMEDPCGWIEEDKGRCGHYFRQYVEKRDCFLPRLFSKTSELLYDYAQRVEAIESFVYVHCVGIQLEKHFSKQRKDALSLWEKKTDITTAINIATKKKMTSIVKELKIKLRDFEDVSHTTVKIAKERHLASKNIKNYLAELARERFARAKVATHRVLDIILTWANHEQDSANRELEAVNFLAEEIERTVTKEDLAADGGIFSSLVSDNSITSPSTASANSPTDALA